MERSSRLGSRAPAKSEASDSSCSRHGPPKLNGHVERAQRTHTEEFYELYDGDVDIGPLNQALRAWERTYNIIRPHRPRLVAPRPCFCALCSLTLPESQC